MKAVFSIVAIATSFLRLASAQLYLQIGQQADGSAIYRSKALEKHDGMLSILSTDLGNVLRGATPIADFNLGLSRYERLQANEVSFTKSLDQGSVALFESVSQDSRIPFITLALIKNSTLTLFTLKDALVTSISCSASDQDLYRPEISSTEWVEVSPSAVEMTAGELGQMKFDFVSWDVPQQPQDSRHARWGGKDRLWLDHEPGEEKFAVETEEAPGTKLVAQDDLIV